jgi:outer membrane receptor protein involved in Fe transport
MAGCRRVYVPSLPKPTATRTTSTKARPTTTLSCSRRLLVKYTRLTIITRFALTVGRRINRPSFWNLNPFKSIMTAYSYQEGNPYLQPEFNTNIEVSHTYKSIFTTAVFLSITNNGYRPVLPLPAPIPILSEPYR